jgi:hypothetical protein
MMRYAKPLFRVERLIARACERGVTHALDHCSLDAGRSTDPAVVSLHLGPQRFAFAAIAIQAWTDRSELGLQPHVANLNRGRLAAHNRCRSSDRFQILNFLLQPADLRMLWGVLCL